MCDVQEKIFLPRADVGQVFDSALVGLSWTNFSEAQRRADLVDSNG